MVAAAAAVVVSSGGAVEAVVVIVIATFIHTFAVVPLSFFIEVFCHKAPWFFKVFRNAGCVRFPIKFEGEDAAVTISGPQ